MLYVVDGYRSGYCMVCVGGSGGGEVWGCSMGGKCREVI